MPPRDATSKGVRPPNGHRDRSQRARRDLEAALSHSYSTLSEELAAANERLTARLSELERRLGLNSGNSSMPPSSDNFGRPEKKAAPRSRRKRGRQPGAGDDDRVRFPR
ncbi:DUF6444 domain-containing protein [Streptomyces uncialis]|uniref:DUF6444 domain-containing protein n=1 Tax=Streptomyces uncialis TaxID=1048205 RepID=UPI0038648F54